MTPNSSLVITITSTSLHLRRCVAHSHVGVETEVLVRSELQHPAHTRRLGPTHHRTRRCSDGFPPQDTFNKPTPLTIPTATLLTYFQFIYTIKANSLSCRVVFITFLRLLPSHIQNQSPPSCRLEQVDVTHQDFSALQLTTDNWINKTITASNTFNIFVSFSLL